MLKVLLFDVDGVLAIGEPWKQKLELDYGIPEEMTKTFFREGNFSGCLVGKADLKEEIAPYLQQWGWQLSTDRFLQYWFDAENNINEPLLGYIQQLRQRGIPCYIATMQERYRTAYILEQMNFGKEFDGIFSTAFVGFKKNKPDFYKHILQILDGIRPEEILFWDDRSENVESAKQVGLQAELYTGFAEFVERMNDYLLR